MSELNIAALFGGFSEVVNDEEPETVAAPPPPAPKAVAAPPGPKAQGSRPAHGATPRPGPRPAPQNPSSRFRTVQAVADAFLGNEVLDLGRKRDPNGVVLRDCIVQANAPHLCQSPMRTLDDLTALMRPGSSGSVDDPDAAFVGFCKGEKGETGCVAQGKKEGVIFSAFSVSETMERQAQARRNAKATAPRPITHRPPPDPNAEQVCSATQERGVPARLADGVPVEACLSAYSDEASKKAQMDAWDALRMKILRTHGHSKLSDQELRQSEGVKLASRNCHLHGHVFRGLGHVMHQLFEHKLGTNGASRPLDAKGKPLSWKAQRNQETRAQREANRAARSAADRARYELVQKGVKTYAVEGHQKSNKGKGGRNGRAHG